MNNTDEQFRSVVAKLLNTPPMPRRRMTKRHDGARTEKRGLKYYYSLASMKVGDGLLVPNKKSASLYCTAWQWAKRNRPGWRFSCKATPGGALLRRMK